MIVLVDGRSGSGKTEFAKALALREPGAQVIRLDDIYPGWHGLDAGSTAVPEILSRLRWRRWDWSASAPAEWHELDPGLPIIVEGVGALSRASRPLADRAVWVETDDATRRERALARDPYFGEHWEMWAAQEEAFIAREDPRSLADLIVDTGA